MISSASKKRIGGIPIALSAVSSGSFVATGTSYNLYSNMRESNDMITLIGYTSPVTFANASASLMDMEQFSDNVQAGTPVYFTLISPTTMEAAVGTTMDFLYASFYE